jgi:hypothetical protein
VGFFKSISNAISNSIKTITNPSQMLSMREDVMRPGGSLTLDDLFRRVDPVLDTLDPIHNVVQEKTTGQSTTAGQSPYFQKIAPMIVDAFFPGVGTMAAGVSNISDGNTTTGVLQVAGGSYAQFGSNNSSAWVKGAGTALKVGSTAYAIYDKNDQLRGYYGGEVPNMVSQTQQATPIYASANFGTGYGRLTAAEGPGVAQAAELAAAKAISDGQNKTLLMLAALAGAAYLFTRG